MLVKKPKRVLHIFSRLDVGGAELRTIDVMRNIDSDKVRFDFVSLSGSKGELDETIRKLGGTVYYCPIKRGHLGSLRRTLRRGRYDAIHSHVSHTSGLMLLLAAMEGIPQRIAHFRTTQEEVEGKLLRRLRSVAMKKLIDTQATDIIAVSEASMTTNWRESWMDDTRCSVIYNGIEIPDQTESRPKTNPMLEFGIPHNSRVVIHVGSLRPEKNHARLLDIFAVLRDSNSEFVLLLVGRDATGMLFPLRTRIRELGLEGSVIYAGARSDIYSLMSQSDIMVFPSIREGLPGAVLEATANGLPVVASDLPGIQEIANHFSSVELLSLKDNDTRWVAQTLLSLEKSALNKQYIAKRFQSSLFTLDNCVNRFMELYGV